jgi:hypothetical protein
MTAVIAEQGNRRPSMDRPNLWFSATLVNFADLIALGG